MKELQEPRTSEAEVEEINQGEAPTVAPTTEGKTPEVQTTEVQTEEAPSSSTSTRRENSRGRKIYITKCGEQHHLNGGFKSLQNYTSYEKEPCFDCNEDPQGVLIFQSGTSDTTK